MAELIVETRRSTRARMAERLTGSGLGKISALHLRSFHYPATLAAVNEIKNPRTAGREISGGRS